MSEFEERNRAKIAEMTADPALGALTREWFVASTRYEYSYHFTWLGRPMIQYPQDVIALQEIIWRTRPELILETGIAHGGSLVFYASMLELLGGDGLVVGVDIDIRPQNRAGIEGHPLAKRIELIEGSSIAEETVARVRARAQGRRSVLVVLDSNHTHDHVRRELDLYSPLVKRDGYLVVFDTAIAAMPDDCFLERPWGSGNNPATAVEDFLSTSHRFVADRDLDNRLLISAAPRGYLKCVAD